MRKNSGFRFRFPLFFRNYLYLLFLSLDLRCHNGLCLRYQFCAVFSQPQTHRNLFLRSIQKHDNDPSVFFKSRHLDLICVSGNTDPLCSHLQEMGEMPHGTRGCGIPQCNGRYTLPSASGIPALICRRCSALHWSSCRPADSRGDRRISSFPP